MPSVVTRRWMIPFLIVALMLTGCRSVDGPELVTFDAAQYREAFDLSAEVARERGLQPGYRDRRTGVLETEPGHAGSIFEPWDRLTLTVGQAVESTFRYQRMRARFEFLPAAFVARDPIRDQRDPIPLNAPPPDLTAMETGEMELRVWVYVEESSHPDMRRDPWSRRLTTRSPISRSDPEDASTQRAWIPVERDRRMERHLLAEIQRRLNARGEADERG